MAGIRRAKGTAQQGKRPIVTEDLRRLIAELPGTLAGRRDAALLLLGFAGGFRRSELVSLDIEDLRFTAEGLVVRLRRSKTDQEGEGREVGIPYGSTPATCPGPCRPNLARRYAPRRQRSAISADQSARAGPPVTPDRQIGGSCGEAQCCGRRP
jgi:integrase